MRASACRRRQKGWPRSARRVRARAARSASQQGHFLPPDVPHCVLSGYVLPSGTVCAQAHDQDPHGVAYVLNQMAAGAAGPEPVASTPARWQKKCGGAIEILGPKVAGACGDLATAFAAVSAMVLFERLLPRI